MLIWDVINLIQKYPTNTLYNVYENMGYTDYKMFCRYYTVTKEDLINMPPNEAAFLILSFNDDFKSIDIINEYIDPSYLPTHMLNIKNLLKSDEIDTEQKLLLLLKRPLSELKPYISDIEKLLEKLPINENINSKIKLLLAKFYNIYVPLITYDYINIYDILTYQLEDIPTQWQDYMPSKVKSYRELFDKIKNLDYNYVSWDFPCPYPVNTLEDIKTLGIEKVIGAKQFLNCLIYDRKPLSLINEYITYCLDEYDIKLWTLSPTIDMYLRDIWDKTPEHDIKEFANLLKFTIFSKINDYGYLFKKSHAIFKYLPFNNMFINYSENSINTIRPLYPNADVKTIKDYFKYLGAV